MAKNPFDIFIIGEKTAFIEELNTEIKYRDLTMAESDAFNKRLLKDFDGKGDPTIDLDEATKINYEKIELALIEPKMTVKDLKKLPTSASKAISAIVKAIDGKEDEIDDEGKSDD